MIPESLSSTHCAFFDCSGSTHELDVFNRRSWSWAHVVCHSVDSDTLLSLIEELGYLKWICGKSEPLCAWISFGLLLGPTKEMSTESSLFCSGAVRSLAEREVASSHQPGLPFRAKELKRFLRRGAQWQSLC